MEIWDFEGLLYTKDPQQLPFPEKSQCPTGQARQAEIFPGDGRPTRVGHPNGHPWNLFWSLICQNVKFNININVTENTLK